MTTFNWDHIDLFVEGSFAEESEPARFFLTDIDGLEWPPPKFLAIGSDGIPFEPDEEFEGQKMQRTFMSEFRTSVS